jgi:uncharacterized membrane protein YfcA
MPDLFASLPVYLLVALVMAGAVTGFLAGLFGVGGGAVMVPVLYEVFGLLGVPEDVRIQLAIGTSLAVIVPTSLRSYFAHKVSGAVLMPVLKQWAVPIVLAVAAGSIIARYADPAVFKLVFIGVAALTSIKLLKPDWIRSFSARLPSSPVMVIYGGLIGLLSALMGIGGGTLSTMALTLHGMSIHAAVATSSGVGVLISLPASIGYALAGLPWQNALPPFSLGFISLPGFLLLIPMSILCAPFGARLAHRLPRRTLEKGFGVFLMLVVVRLIFSL